MSGYGLIDNADEDVLHSARLLVVEDKLFKRLARRLVAPDAPIYLPPQAPPTPPPDSEAVDEQAASKEAEKEKQRQARDEWREEILMEFASFESTITRAAMLIRSNERERQRYAEEKDRIIQTAASVRENTAQLHEKLKDAQAMLSLRKSYDKLAESITKNAALTPRGEQQVDIEKLHLEIAELERESEEYAKTWRERRDQFGRIVEEGKTMLRLIRDEKEEAERQEGMDGVEDANTPRPGSSRGATPKPIDDASTEGEGRLEGNKLLDAVKQADRLDVPISSGTSRATTPAPGKEATLGEGVEDTPMSAPDQGLEEGEEEEMADEPAVQMDTT